MQAQPKKKHPLPDYSVNDAIRRAIRLATSLFEWADIIPVYSIPPRECDTPKLLANVRKDTPVRDHEEFKVCYILVGPPGCGKTKWHSQTLDSDETVVISVDSFFTREDPSAPIDMNRLSDAYKQCRKDYAQAIKENSNSIVVDAYNIRHGHRQWYIDQALMNGYHCYLIVFPYSSDSIRKRKNGIMSEEVISKIASKLDLTPGVYSVFNYAFKEVQNEGGTSIGSKVGGRNHDKTNAGRIERRGSHAC